MSEAIMLDDLNLIKELNALIYEFVMGDYETMIAEKRLRDTRESPQVVRDYVALFPGKLIMTPVFAQKRARAIWALIDEAFPQSKMIAVNLWFLDEGEEKEGDLLLEIIYQENKPKGFDLLIYNVLP